MWNSCVLRSSRALIPRLSSLPAIGSFRACLGSSAAIRTLSSAKKHVGSDPLDILKKECMDRKLCDEEGGRLPGVHWTFQIAVSNEDPKQAPNLRTVGLARVSSMGLDFVLKKTGPTALILADADRQIAMLHQQGKFLPGQKAEQWRGEGLCEPLDLQDSLSPTAPPLIDFVPHFTIVSMVGSKRVEIDDRDTEQTHAGVSEARSAMLSSSHSTEVMQQTRIELENGDLSTEELESAVQGFRLVPDRLECMVGSPDQTVMWDRWEWLRNLTIDPADTPGTLTWNDPRRLVPH